MQLIFNSNRKILPGNFTAGGDKGFRKPDIAQWRIEGRIGIIIQEGNVKTSQHLQFFACDKVIFPALKRCILCLRIGLCGPVFNAEINFRAEQSGTYYSQNQQAGSLFPH